jgi:phosphoglycerol transferase MdoB-like AlkP superfamily enzyme
MKAWLPKLCFSIIFIFIGNFLFFAEKIDIIVLPFFEEVFILHKSLNLFA